MVDYRKIYKNHYNIDFDNKYVVHHIDFNRENNDIKNLMLMPTKLHNKYHFFVNSLISNEDIFCKSFNVKIMGNYLNNRSYNLNTIENIIKTIRECDKWYDYKLYLDGEIPNIHNIKVI